ncbi:MAG TPA: DUF1428 domain-containing protein [Planctomycetota bacterium]|nr:DUF1428 domain-containing protein [Planctomycetota bacterium]
MTYVDGYVLPIPTKNLKAYAAIAKKASKVWKDHGALSYCESVGEDLKPPFGVPFPKAIPVKRGETIVFSFVTFKSRKHRDAVNAKVMKDPRLTEMMDPKKMPFDCSRMVYGGFDALVAF